MYEDCGGQKSPRMLESESDSHSGGSVDDHKAGRNTECLREEQRLYQELDRGYLCYSLANNIVLFCPCLENLSKAEFKSLEE